MENIMKRETSAEAYRILFTKTNETTRATKLITIELNNKHSKGDKHEY